MGSFREQLKFGQVAEGKIAKWLLRKGYTVLPVYEKLDDDKVGPRLFRPHDALVAPDMLVWGTNGTWWIEAKHKSVFTWHRISSQWLTGIDQRHYHDYLEIARSWDWPVWLLFLHECSKPDDRDKPYCPSECPTGLYGGDLLWLENKVHHKHPNWGPSGMVYWAESTLKRIASATEL